MRILIAEDDLVSRRLLEAMLNKWGHEVVITGNGREAWEVLKSPDPPRLAILDWMMPGMNGLQVCRQVRSLCADRYIYIILLTAKSRKEDAIEGLGAGADDFVAKPFDGNELRVRLSAGIRLIELQTELLTTQETLRLQATRDPLTGLPNRLLFSDRLTHDLSHARRRGEVLGTMFLDLDNFKLINDTLGHGIGDELLKQVAERLTRTLRDVDTVARMGGDEFTVVLTDIENAENAENVARKTLAAFKQSFDVRGHEIFITPSIGISLFPNDGEDAETLVKNADTAMYRAKDKGKNSCCVFTEALNHASVERITLDRNLRKAVERNEFIIHYQPRLSITTGRILGAEALVRWKHPQRGIIQPKQFIPVAEETGLIVPIGEFVLREACRQNKAWQDAALPPIGMAVNVSARQFHREDLQKVVKRTLEETGLDPHNLELELTESALMQNTDAATGILEDLRDMGIKLSLDDFGTGYSSLSYLKRFPIHAVKLDQSFVKDITTSTDDAAIAGAVIAMAHSMKLQVIAEGVETLEQLEFLRSLGCDEMQGYFVSRPVPANECEEVLRQNNWPRLATRLRAA